MRYDFALLFTVLTALTGGIWLIDSLLFRRGRSRAIAAQRTAAGERLDALAQVVRDLLARHGLGGSEVARGATGLSIRPANPADAERIAALVSRELPELQARTLDDGVEATLPERADAIREPVLVDYARSLFPVILIILLVRSFLGEPYRIPSASMMPNLLIGDFILVNKYAYGLRLPVLDTKIVAVGEPKRGDVIVFHPPMASNRNEVWIKRVVGLPGDTIHYENYQLSINGQLVETSDVGNYVGEGSGRGMTGWHVVREALPGREHDVLETGFPRPEGNGTWTVPAGHYFMMGDNRDDSEDSRYWVPDHFLPEANIVGKAVVVWMNFDWDARKMDRSRIGTIIR